MARPADINSKRQRGFRILNRITTQRASPANRLAIVMAGLGVDKPYAETIIATHKRQAKKENKFVTIYRVMDRKNGRECKPYISSHGVYTVALKGSDHLSKADAIKAYTHAQEIKIIQADRIK